jgi:hypothetical protein
MVVKPMRLALIIFFASVSVSEAQVFVNGGAPGPGTALGWNFGYVSSCSIQNEGVNTWYFAF